jgi:hypothetical protein
MEGANVFVYSICAICAIYLIWWLFSVFKDLFHVGFWILKTTIAAACLFYIFCVFFGFDYFEDNYYYQRLILFMEVTFNDFISKRKDRLL